MTLEGEGSVTRWVGGLKAGDPEATRHLWDRYFADLVRLARARLRGAPRGVADEEDAALSAFDSFCRGAEHGRFPRLDDRQDLWRVLVMITARKAADLVQLECRLKRGGGNVRSEADLAAGALEAGGLAYVPANDSSPELAVMMAEECRRLFELLPDESLRQVWPTCPPGSSRRRLADDTRQVDGPPITQPAPGRPRAARPWASARRRSARPGS
jgi:ECF sigma factor